MGILAHIRTTTCLGLLGVAFSSSAWAAVMPAGSHAWMVWTANNSVPGTSNSVGPNPPNGIPLTSFSNSNGTHGAASAEILPDRMRSFLSGYSPGFVYQSMWDIYTVHGSAAEPIAITVHLDVNAMGRAVKVNSSWGQVGTAITLEIGTFAHTTEELHEQWRVNAFDPSTQVLVQLPSQVSNAGPFEQPMAGTVSYSRVVSPGEVFELGYGVTIGHWLGRD